MKKETYLQKLRRQEKEKEILKNVGKENELAIMKFYNCQKNVGDIKGNTEIEKLIEEISELSKKSEEQKIKHQKMIKDMFIKVKETIKKDK